MRAILRKLLKHTVLFMLSLTLDKLGKSILQSIQVIAMTTNNSMSVKPACFLLILFTLTPHISDFNFLVQYTIAC